MRHGTVRSDRRSAAGRCLTVALALAALLLAAGSADVRAQQPFPNYGDVFSSGSGSGCNNPYGCANTSRRTGTQSRQPNDAPCDSPFGCGRGRDTGRSNPPGRDVYCQQSPGMPMYGPYRGTGRQTPCGPNFQPAQPAPPPWQEPAQPEPPAEAEQTFCLSTAALEDRAPRPATIRMVAYQPGADGSLLLAQAGGASGRNGLYIGGRQIMSEAESGLQSFLAQAELRREIFRQMSCSKHRRFAFATAEALQRNILLREKIVEATEQVARGIELPRLRARARLFGGSVPAQGDAILMGFAEKNFVLAPDAWVPIYTNNYGSITVNGRPLTWNSQLAGDYSNVVTRDTTAAQAIDAFVAFERAGGSGLGSAVDCLTGLEMVVLVGARRALGTEMFNRLHPMRSGREPHALYGIGAPILSPPGTSSAQRHLIAVRKFGVYTTDEDFLNDRSPPIQQGDMVIGDYVYMQNRPSYQTYASSGGWAGENAVVTSAAGGTPVFYGFGVGYVSEASLRTMMAEKYPPVQRTILQVRGEQMRWTLLAGPVATGSTDEAGPFVD